MNLKEIRESKGFTQKQMAEKMSMEQTTYSKKERGISPINANEWKRLSEIFEIPIEDLHKINCQLTTKNEHKNQQTIQLPKKHLGCYSSFFRQISERKRKVAY
jgi:transcriptional regulator with XRE-family HTH domain